MLLTAVVFCGVERDLVERLHIDNDTIGSQIKARTPTASAILSEKRDLFGVAVFDLCKSQEICY